MKFLQVFFKSEKMSPICNEVPPNQVQFSFNLIFKIIIIIIIIILQWANLIDLSITQKKIEIFKAP